MVGSGNACPGYYTGIEGRVAGPVSAYGVLETYRCDTVPKTSRRLGASAPARLDDLGGGPAVRSGISYSDEGDVFYTIGGSLTMGRRYGARFVVDSWKTKSGGARPLFATTDWTRYAAASPRWRKCCA